MKKTKTISKKMTTNQTQSSITQTAHTKSNTPKKKIKTFPISTKTASNRPSTTTTTTTTAKSSTKEISSIASPRTKSKLREIGTFLQTRFTKSESAIYSTIQIKLKPFPFRLITIITRSIFAARI